MNQKEFLEYQPLINRILAGEVEVEKLYNYRIYKARINEADRLFWTDQVVNGKQYMLILEVILNHDYQKSHFSKPGVLRSYLKKIDGKYLPEPETLDLDIMPTVQASHTKNAYYFNQQFILSTDRQEEAFIKPLPLLVSGPAGSGKSFVLFEMLQKMLENLPEGQKFLYLAKSPYLIRYLKEMWGDRDSRVQFMTYDELMATLDPRCVPVKRKTECSHDPECPHDPHIEPDPDCPHDPKVDEVYFQKWFSLYLEELQRGVKTHKVDATALNLLKQEKKFVYEEFRMRSAYACQPDEAAREDFLARIGNKKSLFAHYENPKLNSMLQDALEKYRVHLETRNLWDPAFHVIHQKHEFDFIALDEGLDFDTLQLLQMFYLAKEGRICYGLDSHQRLYDLLSLRPMLVEMLRNCTGRDVSHVLLEGSHRCPNAVVRFTNRLISIKNRVTGGIGDAHEVREIPESPDREEGEVVWLDPSKQEDRDLHRLFSSPECAVVTLKEHVEEAKKRYSTPLVFTPEEIKGLGYRIIVAYRLQDDSEGLCRKANTKLKSGNLAEPRHRAKANHSDYAFVRPFNQNITAITRATETVYYVQNKILKTITSELIDVISPQPVQPIVPQISTEKDWFDHALQLLKNGSDKQAQAMFTEILHKSQEEFEAFKKEHMPDEPVAITSQPASSNLTSREAYRQQRMRELLKKFTHKNLDIWFRWEKGIESLGWELIGDNDNLEGSLFENMINTPERAKKLYDYLNDEKRTGLVREINQLQFFNGTTILHIAALFNFADLIRLIHAHGGNINVLDGEGYTPFYMAVSFNNVHAVNAFLECGASPHYADNRHLLFRAFEINQGRSHLDVILALIKHEPTLLQTSHSTFGTLLTIAVANNETDIARLLLEEGLPINQWIPETGMAPLHLAAREGNISMVKMLLKWHADVEQRDNADCTPLYYAVKGGHLQAVKLLIAANSPVQGLMTTDPDILAELQLGLKKQSFQEEKTEGMRHLLSTMTIETLHAWIQTHKLDALKWLMKADDGKNAPFLAHILKDSKTAKVFYEYLVRSEQQAEQISALITMLFMNRAHILHFAAEYNQPLLIRLLGEKMNSVDVINNSGFAPIYIAAIKNSLQAVRMLAKLKAKVVPPVSHFLLFQLAELNENSSHLEVIREIVKICDRESLLHYDQRVGTLLNVACWRNDTPLAELLIDSGLPLDTAASIDNLTPIYLAAMHSNHALARMLIQRGVDVNVKAIQQQEMPLTIAVRLGDLEMVDLLLCAGANPNIRFENGATIQSLLNYQEHVEEIRERIIIALKNPPPEYCELKQRSGPGFFKQVREPLTLKTAASQDQNNNSMTG